MISRRRLTNGRVFPLVELDGFYAGNGMCIHITFEDAETIVIDVFDTENAAYNSEDGHSVAPPAILNLRTGKVVFEKWTALE